MVKLLLMSGHELPIMALDRAAADLFAVLSSPFERDFDALGYCARLHLPVQPDAAILSHEGRYAFFEMEIGHKIDGSRPLVAEVGYVSSERTLGFTHLEVPLITPSGNEFFILHRVRQGFFLPLYREKGTEREYSGPLSADNTIYSVGPEFVARFLMDAGYRLPLGFTSPDNLRLRLAELKDRASAWTSEEKISFPEDPTMQIVIRRELGGRHNGKRSEIDVHLTTITTVFGVDPLLRKELEIDFIGADYSVSVPTISLRDLRQVDAILAYPGTETFETIRSAGVKVTPSLLDRLTASMVDALSGV